MCNNYCSRCRREVPVFFRTRRVLIESNYIKTTFVEEYAVCQYCGKAGNRGPAMGLQRRTSEERS